MYIDVVHGPQWFSGLDLVLDLFSVFVLIIISILAWRYYKLNKANKKELYLFTGMTFLGVSFLLKILSYYAIYTTKFKLLYVHSIGKFIINYYNPTYTNLFLGHVLFGLLGLLILFLIFEKIESKKTTFLLLFFILLLSFMSTKVYQVFNLVFLGFVVLIASSFWSNYSKNKLKSTKFLAWSFTVLSLSRLLFIFTNPELYVFAELLQFLGFALLLWSLILVLKHAKKKR